MGTKITDLPTPSLPYTGSERIPLVRAGVTSASGLSSLTTYLSGSGVVVNALNTVSALSSATQEQKQSILPNTVVVDYIQTVDQNNFVIPDNSFGHKGGIPYFGNSPIIPTSEARRYVNRFLTNSTTGPNRWNKSLVTFPVGENDLTDFGYFNFEVDLLFSFTGAAPTPNSWSCFVGLAYQNEIDNWPAGVSTWTPSIALQATPNAAGQERVIVRGSWLLNTQVDGSLGGADAAFLRTGYTESVPGSFLTTSYYAWDSYIQAAGAGPGLNPSNAQNLHLVVATDGAAPFPTGVLVAGWVSLTKLGLNISVDI